MHKFNGIIKEVIEKCPETDLVEFLQDKLQIPPYKAEELAERIRKQYLKKPENKENCEPKMLLKEPEAHAPLESVFSVSCLSDKEFELFIRWLLEELGYVLKPEKHDAFLGVDLFASKDEEDVVFLARRYPQNLMATEQILLLAEQAKHNYGCKKAIVISTANFDSKIKGEMEKANVELWDKNKLDEKICDAIENATVDNQNSFPTFEGSLLHSLLKLDKTEDFIVEPRFGEKYDLHLPGVKFPLLTFQAKNGAVIQCIYRIENNKPVGESEGTLLISVDNQGNRIGPNDEQAYEQIRKYLEKFLK